MLRGADWMVVGEEVTIEGINDFRGLGPVLALLQLLNGSSWRSRTSIAYCACLLLHTLGMAFGP